MRARRALGLVKERACNPCCIVIAIMGCGEGDAPCREVQVAPPRFASEAACAAATARVLERYVDLSYPLGRRPVPPREGGAVQLRGSDVLLPEARPRRAPALRRRRPLRSDRPADRQGEDRAVEAVAILGESDRARPDGRCRSCGRSSRWCRADCRRWRARSARTRSYARHRRRGCRACRRSGSAGRAGSPAIGGSGNIRRHRPSAVRGMSWRKVMSIWLSRFSLIGRWRPVSGSVSRVDLRLDAHVDLGAGDADRIEVERARPLDAVDGGGAGRDCRATGRRRRSG